jgi:hypothetical protein
MYVESAFAFTPAAIIIEAKVCRHSCRPIGSSAGSPDSLLFRFCAFQAIRAGRRTALGVNGRAVVAPIADHLKRGVVGSETPARVRWAQTSERCSGGGAGQAMPFTRWRSSTWKEVRSGGGADSHDVARWGRARIWRQPSSSAYPPMRGRAFCATVLVRGARVRHFCLLCAQ